MCRTQPSPHGAQATFVVIGNRAGITKAQEKFHYKVIDGWPHRFSSPGFGSVAATRVAHSDLLRCLSFAQKPSGAAWEWSVRGSSLSASLLGELLLVLRGANIKLWYQVVRVNWFCFTTSYWFLFVRRILGADMPLEELITWSSWSWIAFRNFSSWVERRAGRDAVLCYGAERGSPGSCSPFSLNMRRWRFDNESGALSSLVVVYACSTPTVNSE